MSCFCNSGKDYEDCCARFHSGENNANTPEELMRSRYSAFAISNMDYIKKTMHGEITKEFNEEEAFEWAEDVDWVGLVVFESKTTDPTHGIVEFEAFFQYPEEKQVSSIHERSTFTMVDGKWYYTGRLFNEHEPVSKDAKCPCGSEKVFKDCCYEVKNSD